jgi:hypothetical protein
LGQIVGYFKYQTTKSINKDRQTPGVSIWQRNYYEHIIRNEKDYERKIRKVDEVMDFFFVLQPVLYLSFKFL